LKEGGRIPGPFGKSVWGAWQPSRVKMNGCAALDCCHAPFANKPFVIEKEGCLSMSFYFEATNHISMLFIYEASRKLSQIQL
jgi:hypothetical protein